MEQVLKVLNDALENKDYQIKYLNEEIDKLRKERDELKAENERVRAYLEQFNNDSPVAADEEDF
jgi:peptidoglycan hydrolase CwlO-like protein